MTINKEEIVILKHTASTTFEDVWFEEDKILR